MKFRTLEQIASATSAALLIPTAAHAACTRGPDVIVNRGHGASITFDEPVYQAQVFDVSKLILEPIPEQGTLTLILTEVEAQQFPGMPHTATTSLLANTANGCYVFEISFGNQPVHNTVSASLEPIQNWHERRCFLAARILILTPYALSTLPPLSSMGKEILSCSE